MKVILLSTILQQILYLTLAEPRYGWHTAAFMFGRGSGGGSSTPPPVSATTVQNHPSSSPPPDTFSTDSEPKLTILYEAMEKNSQKFFQTSLTKEYTFFSTFIDIQLVPCIQGEGVASDRIACPAAADKDCKADRIHSCAIDIVTNKTELIDYLACTMNGVNKLPDFPTCASQNKMNDNDLQACANSEKGMNLCRDYSGKKIKECMDKIPIFFFKNKDDIKPDSALERIDLYRSSVCEDDLHSAICAKLVTCRAPKIPDDCKKKLVIGIFYKVMDEKSQAWFHLLNSIFDKFSNYLVFRYQPCMFAETTENGKLGCKDENDENCVAGKTHACAIKQTEDPASLFGFLNCTMQDTKKLPDFQKCATENKVQYDSIKKCADSDEGKNLCIYYSKMRPADDIPAFSFELTFDIDTSKKASDEKDLKTVFCDQLKKYGIALPPDCQ